MTSYEVFSRVGYHGNWLEYSYAEERFVIRQAVYYTSCFDSGKLVNNDLLSVVREQNIRSVIE
jgi:hypothetical protein